MPFPSLAVIARRLSEVEIERLLTLKRIGPRLERLEARRAKIIARIATVDRKLAELTWTATKKRPDRQLARQVKNRPGRIPAAKAGAGAAARKAAMLKHMAKMRAALAVKWRKTA